MKKIITKRQVSWMLTHALGLTSTFTILHSLWCLAHHQRAPWQESVIVAVLALTLVFLELV